MRPLLYLDTARLGLMTPAAKDAQLDFVRLSAEEPSSLYFENFLRHGFAAWPNDYQQRFPGLRTWLGVRGLKNALRNLVGAPADHRVLFASRSLSLVKLAASCQFRVCRNVLTTDLSWPTYQQAIEHRAARTHNRVTTVALRDNILSHRWSVDDVANFLADAFIRHRCDGLFLPAVDHLGIKLPLLRIVEKIRERSELRFCFIDAAQALCHVPLEEALAVADFLVAGTHKWMGAYLPMGLGLFGHHRTREMIDHRLHWLDTHHPTDPLLHFTEQLDTDHLDSHSETANLTPLFACAGATHDAPPTSARAHTKADDEVEKAISFPTRWPWQAMRPSVPFQSRVVLYQPQIPSSAPTSADEIRREWQQAGFVISAYDNGTVRVSLPRQ